jgi:hypothetical protein
MKGDILFWNGLPAEDTTEDLGEPISMDFAEIALTPVILVMT